MPTRKKQLQIDDFCKLLFTNWPDGHRAKFLKQESSESSFSTGPSLHNLSSSSQVLPEFICFAATCAEWARKMLQLRWRQLWSVCSCALEGRRKPWVLSNWQSSAACTQYSMGRTGVQWSSFLFCFSFHVLKQQQRLYFLSSHLYENLVSIKV